MRYKALACAALWLGACAAHAAAGDDTYEVHFPARKASLGVVGGRATALTLAGGESYDWALRRAAPKTNIEVLSPEKWRGRFLAYDPDGKGKDKGAVFLAAKRGAGTEWLVERVKGDGTYTIRAASGKLKGWYLDVADKGEGGANNKGKKATVYKVFLSEKPKKVPKWELIQISP